MCVSRRCLKTPHSTSPPSALWNQCPLPTPPSSDPPTTTSQSLLASFASLPDRRFELRGLRCDGEVAVEVQNSVWRNHLPILITRRRSAAEVNMSIKGPPGGRDQKRPAAYEMQIGPFRMHHTPLSCVISAMSAHSNYLGKCTN